MRIPLTDKFLWDVYCFCEKIGEVLEPPEILKIKPMSQIGRLWEPAQYRYWKEYEKKRRKRQFGQFIYYLKRKGYIKIKNLEEGKGILLTARGRQKALVARNKLNLNPRLEKRKDGKWLMVIFDIPEKLRKHRDEFRDFLQSLGFKKLQQSVWVSPFDVYKNLEEIIRTYFLDRFVRIFLIKEIEV